MSGETKESKSAWTVDSLKEHVEQRFSDAEKAVDAALEAVKIANRETKDAAEKRFDLLNELRTDVATRPQLQALEKLVQGLTDRMPALLPRPEYDVQHQALEDKVQIVTDWMIKTQGATQGSQISRTQLYGAIAAVGTVLGIIVLLANNVFRH